MIWPEGKHPMHSLRKSIKLTSIRILTPWYTQNQHISYPKTNWQKFDLKDESKQDGRIFKNEHVDVKKDHHLLARKIAAESTVYAFLSPFNRSHVLRSKLPLVPKAPFDIWR